MEDNLSEGRGRFGGDNLMGSLAMAYRQARNAKQ